MLTIALASCQTRPVSAYGKKGKVFLCLLGAGGSDSTLRVLDLTDMSFEDFDIPIKLPHSLIQNAANSDEVYIFELLGSAVKLNLKDRKTILVENKSGSKFFGHAVQSSDRQLIWTTEMMPGKGAVVYARNASDLSLVQGEEYSFQGGHHVIRLPGTDILVSGGSSKGVNANFVHFYDPSTKKIIRRLPMEDVPIHMIGISSSEILGVTNVAVAEGKNKEYASSSEPSVALKLQTVFDFKTPSPVFYGNLDGNSKSWLDAEKKDLFRFNFGIERVPGKDLKFLTSHNHSDSVILWKDYKIERVINVKAPKAISVTNDGSQLLIHSADLELLVYSMKTFQLEKKINYDRPVGMVSRYV